MYGFAVVLCVSALQKKRMNGWVFAQKKRRTPLPGVFFGYTVSHLPKSTRFTAIVYSKAQILLLYSESQCDLIGPGQAFERKVAIFFFFSPPPPPSRHSRKFYLASPFLFTRPYELSLLPNPFHSVPEALVLHCHSE